MPRLLGWNAARQRERTDELLGLVGLDPARYRDRYPSQLSGGERQRVGVARALAADPPVMLMDEPFGAVDPIVRDRLQNEFLRLQDELAKTILFVTHDIDEAIKMGDLVAVMQAGGTLAQFGTPGRDPGQPGLGLRRPLRRRRPRAEAAVARPGRRPRPARRSSSPAPATTPPTPARRLAADPFPYLLLVDERDRPIGWVDPRHLPADGTLTADLASPMSPLLGPRTTLKDALSMLLGADVQAGIVVDGSGRAQGIVTLDAIVEELRAPGRAGGPGVIRWDWIRDNLGVIGGAVVDHLVLTVLAIVIGLAISFVAALVIRRRRILRGPITATFGVLYTIPSLALFAFLVPFTGLTLVTAEIGLISYTLLILTRNILAGLEGIPAEVREAADGMGYTGPQRLHGRRAAAGPAGDHDRDAGRDRHDRRPGHGHRRDRRGRPRPADAARVQPPVPDDDLRRLRPDRRAGARPRPHPRRDPAPADALVAPGGGLTDGAGSPARSAG